MAVKIRLSRKGTRNVAFYRLVAADERARRNGNNIEELGWFNPLSNPKKAQLNAERIQYWLGQGAQLTDGAKLLLDKEGIVTKTKIQGPAVGTKRKKADKLTKAEKRKQAEQMVKDGDASAEAAPAAA